MADLVGAGAALGWLEPPSPGEIATLLAEINRAVAANDSAVRYAYERGELVGFGYWRRYERPTHRPHADLEKLAVARSAQGRGVGGALLAQLIEAARVAGIEVLTLDVRGDNASAQYLYQRFGFREYGRLPRFVAVGKDRYEKVFYALDLRAPG